MSSMQRLINFVVVINGNEADRAAFRPGRADRWESCLGIVLNYANHMTVATRASIAV